MGHQKRAAPHYGPGENREHRGADEAETDDLRWRAGDVPGRVGAGDASVLGAIVNQ